MICLIISTAKPDILSEERLTVNVLATAISSASGILANSANPDITRAGGPAGISIMLNQRMGSSWRMLVFLARA